MSVKVLNLTTGEILVYVGIDQTWAVVCAYEQARGNHNTWTYPREKALRHPKLEFGPSGRTVYCGDFAATFISW